MMIRITLQYLIVTITSITGLFSLTNAQPVPYGSAFPIERNLIMMTDKPPGLAKPHLPVDSGSMQPIIEPGSVQLPELLLQPLQPEFDPNQPLIWEIRTEIVNPYTVKVTWSGINGATSYELYRNDTLITKLSAAADTHQYSFTDDGLGPDYNYSYVVKAIKVYHLGTLNPTQAEALRNRLNLSVTPLGSGQGTDMPKELRQELAKSKPEQGVTPSIVAPHNFKVTTIDPLKRIVRLEWKPPTQWATKVQILRDGVPLSNPLAIMAGAGEMSFDDTTVTKGAHTYALKTRYEYDFLSSLPPPTPTVNKPGQPNLDTLDHRRTPIKLERRHFDSALTPGQTLYLGGDPMLVGTGISDITGPIAEVVMMGYANPDQVSSGLHMRLYARAFVFANPNNDRQRIVFVSAELGQLFSSIKQGVIKKLTQRYGDLYDDRNVQIAATHTHAGPGGYSHHAIFNLTSFGHVTQNYTAIVDGITEAIIQAHDRLAPATLSVAAGNIDEKASVNRSKDAFDLNPDSLKGNEVNPEVTMLRIDRSSPVGVISWFSVHNTSLTNKNKLVSSDHKGWASYKFEKMYDSIAPLHRAGEFVAAFPNGDEGDLSPNIEAGFHGPGYHEGKDQFYSMQIIGDREFNTANRLFHDMNRNPVDGDIDFRHMFVEMPGYVVASTRHSNGVGGNTLCSGAYGMSFAAGAEDGPSEAPFFHEGMVMGENVNEALAISLRGVYAAPMLTPFKESFLAMTFVDYLCQMPKPVLIPSGQLGWTPEVLPFQLLRVGSIVIAGIPGEMTAQGGRRLRARILNSLSSIGVNRVILTGLANEYSGYIATPEEYDSQQYEGASTLFGRLTFDAYLQIFGQLADAMATGQPVPTGPMSPDLSRVQIEFQTGVWHDDKLPAEQFGEVLIEPPPEVIRGDGSTIVQATFRSGHPKNDLRRNSTYLHVERLDGDGNWIPVAWDSMPETSLIWERNEDDKKCAFSACSRVHVRWAIPKDAELGTYRLTHAGAWKLPEFLGGKISSYSGSSRSFSVK